MTPVKVPNALDKLKYVFHLYTTGSTLQSTRAISNIKALCEEHLPGRYELEVIDLYQRPELASEAQVVAVPTLVKSLPAPLKQFIGDLSDKDRLLVALNLQGAA